MSSDLKDVSTHFAFGENWRDYSKHINGKAIEMAEAGVLKLLPRDVLRGRSFLDIGSGSGLHSLAAARLGASQIHAIDIDDNSVKTTSSVLEAHGVDAKVEVCSVFEMDHIGKYDIVYSWGVLHHTGDMWTAIRNAAAHVADDGYFAIALYQKTPSCKAWTVEKKLYTASPSWVQRPVRLGYASLLLLAHSLRGRNPYKYVKNYNTLRGMTYWHDVHDWLGGYPYESSTPQETQEFVCSLGFEPVSIGDLNPGMGIFGTGCAEYVFRRKGINLSTSKQP